MTTEAFDAAGTRPINGFGGPGLESSIDHEHWVRRFRLLQKSTRGAPISGSSVQVADHLRSFATAGVEHIQVWLDPHSLQGVERFVRVLEILDDG